MTTLQILQDVLNSPTAPFREQFVSESIKKILIKKKLNFFEDRFGNLVVGVKNATELRSKPKLILMAHMDHPGFLVKKQKNLLLDCVWYGGGPLLNMKDAKVRIYDPSLSSLSTKGTIVEFEKGKYKRTGMKMKVKLNKSERIAPGSFGAFDFPSLKIRNNLILTRVADDLVGVVMAIGALLDSRKSKNAVAVFTRAEEVGFVGCWSFLQHYPIHSKSIAVSLEASRTLPEAEVGKGPVVRLGDRSTYYDNLASNYLLWVASQSKMKFQKRIMDGGSCEATALNLFGVKTTGLAIPLKNYHNQGNNNKPAPEIVNLSDVESGRALCAEAVKQFKKCELPVKKLKQTLEQNHKRLK